MSAFLKETFGLLVSEEHRWKTHEYKTKERNMWTVTLVHLISQNIHYFWIAVRIWSEERKHFSPKETICFPRGADDSEYSILTYTFCGSSLIRFLRYFDPVITRWTTFRTNVTKNNQGLIQKEWHIQIMDKCAIKNEAPVCKISIARFHTTGNSESDEVYTMVTLNVINFNISV